MRYSLLVLATIVFSCLSLFSQEFATAPLNPDFIEYQKKAAREDNLLPPSPTAPFFATKTILRNNVILPEKFDLREETTLSTPRNQGIGNTCWGFATFDAIQSTWARQSFSTPDYSVENLVNCSGFEAKKKDGGNRNMSTAYLTRHGGPVFEIADPYINSNEGTCKPNITDADKDAIVSQVLFLPKDVSAIKQMIYQYGGVMTGMCNDALRNPFFNENTHASYINVKEGHSSNHAVTIVGWDDNFDKEYFNTKPSANGAWIVKNTVGTAIHEGGYFYASYEDVFMGSEATVFPKRIEKSAIDTIYYYDKLGMIKMKGMGVDANNKVVSDSAFARVKYTTPQRQKITHIGTYTASAGATIDFKLIKIKKNGRGELAASRTGIYCEQAGYHTFEVDVEHSGDFYIEMKYKTPDYGFPLPVEDSIENYAAVEFEERGVQWIKFKDEDPWISIGKDLPNGGQFDLCIKAYAKNLGNVPYDNIEDAYQLRLNTQEGPFSNIGATVQENEPYPTDDSSCSSQVGWCEGESVLHNSIWFKFEAPSEGIVDITTSGFDNQIAVYDAARHEDLLTGNYTLLAANDDASDSEPAARILNLSNLTPGKTYWLQMDGSFNGDESNNSFITISSTSKLPNAQKKPYQIINPVENKLLDIKQTEDVKEVYLFDLGGNIVSKTRGNALQSMQINLSHLEQGCYILQIFSEHDSYQQKVILK